MSMKKLEELNKHLADQGDLTGLDLLGDYLRELLEESQEERDLNLEWKEMQRS